MTYPPGPDHLHAHWLRGVPAEIDPTGVPRDGSGHEAFIMLVGIGVALLALIFTLGWVVFHHLQMG